MANTISVSVLGDVRDINRKLGAVESQLGGFGKKISGVGKLVAGAFAGAAVIDFFKGTVKAASDAQQSVGATSTVFGKAASDIVKASQGAADKYGLSANTYRENANLIGSLFKNQGVATDQLASKTDKMIGIGADLAATFGGTTTDAVGALGAAFKGEYDQLERYGISLKESTVSAELAARGQSKLTGAALASAKQQVVTDLIMKQSKDSTGAFARETNTLAHQQQVLAAKVENAKAAIGNAFLPVLTKVAAFISDVVLPKLKQFGLWFQTEALPPIQAFASQVGAVLLPILQQIGALLTGVVIPGLIAFGTWLRANAAWLAPIAVGILAIVAAWKVYKVAMTVAAAATKAYAVVQAALNVVMAMNPIGLLVLAIVGLIAALVYAWKTNDEFRAAVTNAWKAIKSGASNVFGWLKNFVSAAFSFIKTAFTRYTPLGLILSHFGQIRSFVTGAVNAVRSGVSGAWNSVRSATASAWSSVRSATSSAWNAVKSSIQSVWNGIKTATSNAISAVIALVRGIRGRVTGAFSGAAGWLLSAGRNVIQGLMNGITGMAGSVAAKAREVVSGAINAAKSALGINSPSRVFLDIGRNTGKGLVMGLERMGGKVATASSDLARDVANGFEAPKLSLAAASGTGGGGNTYHLTVNALDPQSASRAVIEAIRDHERLNGTGWRR